MSMTAYLIDPANQTITQVEHSGDYRQIYALIDCETFDVARLNKGDGIFIDDEGMMKPNDLFIHEDYPNPLAGKGLVLGCNFETGESQSAQCTLEELKKKVAWAAPVRINGMVHIVPIKRATDA